MFPRWVAWFNVVIALALVPAGFAGLTLSGVVRLGRVRVVLGEEHRHRAVDRRDGVVLATGDGARPRSRSRPPREHRRRRCARDPKRELWFVWYSTVAFYSLYTVVFFVLTRTQPPGQPWLSPDQTVDWFADRPAGACSSASR